MATKALFFDLDGTLAVGNKPAAEEDAAALRGLRKAGHRVLLCTGRAPCFVYPEIREIGFDGIVAGAGTYIEWGGTKLYSHPLDSGLLRRAVSFFLEHPWDCVLEGEQNMYAIHAEGTWLEGRWPVVTSASDFEAGGPYAGEPVLKFSCSAKAREAMAGLFDGELTAIDHEYALELIPYGCSKAGGIRRVLEHMGISRADSVAFGDSRNDTDMLAYAGVGVAMGSAPEDVKAAADLVTGTLEEHGVAQAIRRLGL